MWICLYTHLFVYARSFSVIENAEALVASCGGLLRWVSLLRKRLLYNSYVFTSIRIFVADFYENGCLSHAFWKSTVIFHPKNTYYWIVNVISSGNSLIIARSEWSAGI